MPPLSLLLGLGGLGLQGANYISSLFGEDRAQKQLDALSRQPLPKYTVDPSILKYYQTQSNLANNPQGYSAAERANFNTNLNRTLATQAANARSLSGGNLGRAINAMGVAGNVGALNQFAASDASLARQQQQNAFGRQLSAANTMQNIGNMNTSNMWQRRLMQEQALGNAVRQQRDYQKNILGGLGSDLLGGGLMAYLNGVGGGTNNFADFAKRLKFNSADLSGVDPNEVPAELFQ